MVKGGVRLNLLILICVVSVLCGCGARESGTEPQEAHAEYWGMAVPGLSPELFALDVLPPEGAIMHSSPAFAPDGTEVYFSAYYPDRRPRQDVVLFLERGGNGWSAPQTASFSGMYNDDWPWFAPDGERLYFSSRRPVEAGGEVPDEYGLWYVDRSGGGWSAPKQIVAPADLRRDEGTIVVAATLPGGYGDMDIYRLDFGENGYGMPENLGPAVNTAVEEYAPCLAPDGRYLVFNRFEAGPQPRVSLFVSFAMGDGGWSEAQELGEGSDEFRDGRFPMLSPEGEYLFWVAAGGEAIYWADSGLIDEYRPEE